MSERGGAPSRLNPGSSTSDARKTLFSHADIAIMMAESRRNWETYDAD